MSGPRWYGRLAEGVRQVPPLLADAAIAVACYLVTGMYLIIDGDGAVWLLAVLAANAAPLVWRRRYPFAVTLVAGVFTVWLALADALHPFPVVQLVATYTFAALCPPWLRLIAGVGTAVGITASLLGAGEDPLAFGPVVVMFIAAYALGTGARARRHRIAMLEERARRHAEEHAAAATQERERIAREMHDILAHSMSLVVVQAEAGPVAVRSDPDKAEAVFDTISATARQALAQLRRALGVLRSDDPGTRLPQPGLAALPALVASVDRAGLAATLTEVGERRPMPPDLAATAYRIVQESLTNTVRHSRASEVEVRLEWRDGRLDLTVRDNGRGPTGTEDGHGLVGMRERAAAAGGELTAGSRSDGTGFQVTARLPVP